MKEIRKYIRKVLLENTEAGTMRLTVDRDEFFRNLQPIEEIKTKEEIARYNATIERINMLYQNRALNTDITEDIEDTYFFFERDIDKRDFDEIVEEKMDELDNLTDEELASGQENAIDFLDESEIPLNLTIEELIIQAKGLTENIGLAGYILRDGGLLDFFGDNPDRADHRTLEIPINEWRTLDGTEIMFAFMDTIGAIRTDGDRGTIHMRTEPTMNQWRIIERIVLKNKDDFYIDAYREGRNSMHLRAPMALDMLSHKIDEFYG